MCTLYRCLDEILLSRYKDDSSDDESPEQDQSESDDVDESAPKIVYSNHGNKSRDSALDTALRDDVDDEIMAVESSDEDTEKENKEESNKVLLLLFLGNTKYSTSTKWLRAALKGPPQ